MTGTRNGFTSCEESAMATVDVTGSEPPSALREPLRNASGGWIAKWTLGSFGWLMPMYAAGQILLPKQATAVAGNSQETVLGWSRSPPPS